MISPTWIIESLKMFKLSAQVVNFIKTLEKRRVELAVGGQTITEVKIQRGILQEDSLKPQLFVIMILLN